MSYFVITGKVDCPNCAHALYVASYLHTRLPNFRYQSILKEEADWPTWLERLNSDNRWYHTTSPLIWKEINRRGGRAYLIGGLSEFWEYCYDYYGFQSRISKSDLTKIVADNAFIASHFKKPKDLNISIVGALNSMLGPLLVELQDCLGCTEEDKPSVKLFDVNFDEVDLGLFLLEVVDEITPSLKWRPDSIAVVTNLADALQDCDLLLVIEDFSRFKHESGDDWFSRCRSSMLLLAEEMNTYAKRGLRVVLSHDGPICFNASILVTHCTTIRLANIVAVTADEGISKISTAAKYVNDLVENFSCPPVWGFTGVVSYVDIGSTVIKTDVYRPYKRALTMKPNSKLSKGVIQTELRLLSRKFRSNEPLYTTVEKLRKTKGPSFFVKVRATASLLKLWFADRPSDDIISLGVCSNGSFGLPPGAVYSQAVMQNEKRVWEPLSNFPMPQKTCIRINSIALEVEDLLKKYGIGEKKI